MLKEEFFVSEVRISGAVNDFPTIVGVSSNVLKAQSQYTTQSEEMDDTSKSLELLTSTPRYAFVIKPKTSNNEEHFVVPGVGQYSEQYIKAVGFVETRGDLLRGLNIGSMSSNTQPGTPSHIISVQQPEEFVSCACRKEDKGETTVMLLEEQNGITHHAFMQYLKQGTQYRDESVFARHGLDINNQTFVALTASTLNKKMEAFFKNVVGLIKPHIVQGKGDGSSFIYVPPSPTTLGDISISIADATKSGLWTWKAPWAEPTNDQTLYDFKLDLTITGFKKKVIPQGITIYPRRDPGQVATI